MPTQNIESALIETSRIAHLTDSGRANIKLPNGNKLLLPFKSNNIFKQQHLQIRGEAITFDTVLLFPIDAVIQDYMETKHMEEVVIHEGEKCLPLGYLYLSIQADQKYSEFAFNAPSSSMNTLLLESKSIHKQFSRILNAGNGVLGLIDVGTNRFNLLSDPSKSILLNAKPLEDTDIDSMVNNLLRDLA